MIWRNVLKAIKRNKCIVSSYNVLFNKIMECLYKMLWAKKERQENSILVLVEFYSLFCLLNELGYYSIIQVTVPE